MNSALVHALYLGAPVAVFAVLALLIYSRKGNHPATYQLSQPWTYGPVLWSATEETLGGHGGHSTGHGHAEVSVGGGASGSW